jgi:hypothetical protein
MGSIVSPNRPRDLGLLEQINADIHAVKVLAQGHGSWDGTIVNPENPTRRDTQMAPALGYIVIEMDVDRPGLWPFHCVSDRLDNLCKAELPELTLMR